MMSLLIKVLLVLSIPLCLGGLGKVSFAQTNDDAIPSRILPNSPKIEIVKAEGLKAKELAALKQQIKLGTLPPKTNGEVVVQFQVREGRVGRVLFNDKTSTIVIPSVQGPIKKVLTAWTGPKTLNGNVSLVLKITP